MASDWWEFENVEAAATSPGDGRLAEKAAIDCTAAETCTAVMLWR
ncbi:MAG: hypothetical protein ACRD2O_02415 [Terriglobia bacterium]